MTKWSISLLVCSVLATATFLGCTGGCQPKASRSSHNAADTPRVRVRLLAAVPKITLLCDRPAAVTDARNGRAVPMDLTPGRAVDVSFDGRNVRAGDAVLPGVPLRIVPTADGAVTVNGAAYRGTYVIVPAEAGKLDLVNDVDVESYLQGVLARELLPDWDAKAYEAQAVIARTYALYEARTNPAGRHWDLNPDERSQVYGGMKAETAKANAAVAATRGMVAAYGPSGQERIFKAYFSSCCGGVSSSAADVFNEPAIRPLSAKPNGAVCSISPRFAWPAVTLSKVELTRRLRAWGVKQGRPEAALPGVRSISVASVNSFGRPRTYMLSDLRNQQYVLTAEQLRWAINTEPDGGPTVWSGFFTPQDTGDAIRFSDGHGFGHGVGACQWCMQARALAGEDFKQIVTAAFPQSVLVQAY